MQNPFEAPQALLLSSKKAEISEDTPSLTWLGISALQLLIFLSCIFGKEYLKNAGVSLLLTILAVVFIAATIIGGIKKKIAFLILQFIFVLCSAMFYWMLFIPTALE